MDMADRLTETQMLQLVEIYRDYEFLWNVTHTLYKNRDVRETAYKQIWERLNVPGLSVKDIPKKIKNLRSSYYQELKRIDSSIRSGASHDSVYKPKVSWFTTADGFLKTFRNKQETLWNIDESSNTEAETQNGNDNVDDEAPTDQKDPKKGAKKGPISHKEEDIQKAIAKIDQIASTVTKRALEKKDDEFDSFGKYIAMTLRSLPSELAIVAKLEMQKTMCEIQLRALSRSSQSKLLSDDISTS